MRKEANNNKKEIRKKENEVKIKRQKRVLKTEWLNKQWPKPPKTELSPPSLYVASSTLNQETGAQNVSTAKLAQVTVHIIQQKCETKCRLGRHDDRLSLGGGTTFWITECLYPPPFPRFRLSLLGPVSFFFGINKTHTFKIPCWQSESVRLSVRPCI